MKKTAYTSSALSIMVLILGMLSMLYGFPYTNYIISISLLLLAVALIIFYTLEKQTMYIAGGVFCTLPITGLFMNQLNMPGAKFLVTIGLILFALFFVPWFTFKWYKK